jgi:hypothetical protein
VIIKGGSSGIHIARFADDGTSEILDTSFNGIDVDSNMVFTGRSPRGLSIFALISVKAQAPAVTPQVTPQPAPVASSRNDASASLVFVPPVLVVIAGFFVFRKN